jgi:hypothetical protein
MPFKEEVYVSGKDMKRVHVTYRLAKVENVGVANMTDKQATATVNRKKAAMRKAITAEVLAELTPKKEPEKPEGLKKP